ncbi:MAG: hypothetical protein CYG60_16570 [Actinobacteria bacterium]|nr:MAG: hypothetical protein CYG60_16570 [Actinomycetota bacterium]
MLVPPLGADQTVEPRGAEQVENWNAANSFVFYGKDREIATTASKIRRSPCSRCTSSVSPYARFEMDMNKRLPLRDVTHAM